MKKFRGKKRYFLNLQKETAAAHHNLDFSNEGWFNLWHAHLDFEGVGNRSIKVRRQHVKAHLSLYKSLVERLESSELSFQSWVVLNNAEAGHDAVYIHTPNPHEDNFPFKVEHIKWGTVLPYDVKDLIDATEFEVGQYGSDPNHSFVIQLKRTEIKIQ